MLVRFLNTNETWDVVDPDCEFRPCFWPGYDKGSFTPGVGYTSYHPVPRPVCMERHVRGCPYKVREDGSAVTDERGVCVKLDPRCCDSPNVPRPRPGRPVSHVQRCRSCGKRLSGGALAAAREAT